MTGTLIRRGKDPERDIQRSPYEDGGRGLSYAWGHQTLENIGRGKERFFAEAIRAGYSIYSFLAIYVGKSCMAPCTFCISFILAHGLVIDLLLLSSKSTMFCPAFLE